MAASLTPHEERVVAVHAGCDPRTVRAYIVNPSLTRSTVAARIRDALVHLRVSTLIPNGPNVIAEATR